MTENNVTGMPGLVKARQFIELDGNGWWREQTLLDETRPDHAELMASAEKVVARQLKDALWGRGALFGRERLLALCARIIDEDFDPHGPQTEHYDLENYADEDDARP